MKDLKNTSPGLKEIPKKNPFITPDGYFDNFALNMQHQIGNQDKHENVRVKTLLKPAWIFVYTVILGFLVWGGGYMLSIQDPSKNYLSEDDIAAYTYLNFFDFNDYSVVAAYYPEDELNQELNIDVTDYISEYDLIDENDTVNY